MVPACSHLQLAIAALPATERCVGGHTFVAEEAIEVEARGWARSRDTAQKIVGVASAITHS